MKKKTKKRERERDCLKGKEREVVSDTRNGGTCEQSGERENEERERERDVAV